MILLNLILWAIPSNLLKLSVKGKPVFLNMYSLEKLSFLFLMIPISGLLIYLISASKKSIKKRIFAIIVILVVTLPGLFLMDLSLRFIKQARYVKTDQVYHRPPSKSYTVVVKDKPKSDKLPIIIQPGYPDSKCTLTTDKHGFRNKKILKEYDIVVLGDSFTEGSDVTDDEIWPQVLAKESGYSVYNLGMSGTDPLDYFLTLKQFGRELSPKIIICTIYQGNDLRDNGIPADRIREMTITHSKSGADIIEKKPLSFKKKLRRYRKESPVLNAVRKLFSKYLIIETEHQKKNNKTVEKVENNKIVDKVQNNKKSEILSWLPIKIPEDKNSKYYFFKSKRMLPFWQSKKELLDSAGWKNCVASLKKIKEFCEKNNIRLIVTMAPLKPVIIFPLLDKTKLPIAEMQEFAKLASKHVPEKDKFIETLFKNLPNQESALKEFCSNNNIEYVSTTEALRKSMKAGEQVYFTYDQHWTPKGHKVVAETLAKYLKNKISLR